MAVGWMGAQRRWVAAAEMYNAAASEGGSAHGGVGGSGEGGDGRRQRLGQRRW